MGREGEGGRGGRVGGGGGGHPQAAQMPVGKVVMPGRFWVSNDSASNEGYSLSLREALPISNRQGIEPLPRRHLGPGMNIEHLPHQRQNAGKRGIGGEATGLETIVQEIGE